MRRTEDECLLRQNQSELPADRGPRHHRRPAFRRAGRPQWLHRQVLPASLRLSQRFRRAAGRPKGRALQHSGGYRFHGHRPRIGRRNRAGIPPVGAHRTRHPRRSQVPHGMPAGARLCARAGQNPSRSRPPGCKLFLPSPTIRAESQHPLHAADGAVAAEFVLPSGKESVFVLRHREGRAGRSLTEPPADATQLLNETTRYWRAWAGRSRYRGRWREMVARSALALKHLSAHRRNRGRPHCQPARAGRRRAQLGLPIHLGSGCRLYRLFADASGLHR